MKFQLTAILLLLLLWAAPSFSQQKTRFGIQGGVGKTIPQGLEPSDFGDRYIHVKSLWSAKLGVFAFRHLGKRATVKATVFFSQKGWRTRCNCFNWPTESDGPGSFIRDPSIDERATFKTWWANVQVDFMHRYGQRELQPFWSLGLGVASPIGHKADMYMVDFLPREKFREKKQFPVYAIANLGIISQGGYSISLSGEYFLVASQLEVVPKKYNYLTPGIEFGVSF